MIVPEKVRAMNKQEKFKYYLNRYMSDDTGENQKKDAITVISELMQGVPVEKIAEEFGVTCEYNLKVTPATITVKFTPEDETVEKTFTFDINVPDRDQFDGAKPEAQTRPIKSMLTEKEQKELLEGVETDQK